MGLKHFAYIAGMATLIACWVTILYAFVVAYFNGYKATIAINNYGEAHIEMAMLVLFIPAVCYTIYHIHKLRRGELDAEKTG